MLYCKIQHACTIAHCTITPFNTSRLATKWAVETTRLKAAVAISTAQRSPPLHYCALRNLATYGYQIPEKPDQLRTPSVGDSIRSLSLDITCGDDVRGGTCGEIAS